MTCPDEESDDEQPLASRHVQTPAISRTDFDHEFAFAPILRDKRTPAIFRFNCSHSPLKRSASAVKTQRHHRSRPLGPAPLPGRRTQGYTSPGGHPGMPEAADAGPWWGAAGTFRPVSRHRLRLASDVSPDCDRRDAPDDASGKMARTAAPGGAQGRTPASTCGYAPKRPGAGTISRVIGHRIPEATVNRLPVYLRALAEASSSSPTISSELLAEKAGVNAAQVRKDLSHLGSYGTRGVGYEVGYLMHQISRRLGVDNELRVAIVGAGNLGQALATYGGFASRGFQVVATFDSDLGKVGHRVGTTSVRHASTMPDVLLELKVDIGVVTTPASAAQSTADILVAGGVSCILNFAPTTVVVPEYVALRQVDLGVELQILSFYRQSDASPVAAGE